MQLKFRWSTLILQVALVAISACFAPVATELITPTPVPTKAQAAPAQSATQAPAETAAQAPAAQSSGQSRLDIVKERGQLVCGVNGQLPGFSFLDSSGNYSGFDVDFCKAVAAAVMVVGEAGNAIG